MGADLVHRNFIWRIESMTPSDEYIAKKFVYVESLRFDEETNASRLFSVTPTSQGEIIEPSDLYFFRQKLTFDLVVMYSRNRIRTEALFGLILQDAKSIIALLYNPGYYRGYSDENSLSSTGLELRQYKSSRIITSNYNTRLTQSWDCIVSEVV